MNKYKFCLFVEVSVLNYVNIYNRYSNHRNDTLILLLSKTFIVDNDSESSITPLLRRKTKTSQRVLLTTRDDRCLN